MALTKWKQTFRRDGCAYKNGLVYVYLSGTTEPARVFDTSFNLIDTAPQLYTDGTGKVEFSLDADDYPTGQLFDIVCKSGECYQKNDIELKSLMILQDTEGGRNFKQTFAQATAPTEDGSNLKEGDLFFHTADSNHLYRWELSGGSYTWVSARDGSIFSGNWSDIVDDDGNRPEDGADVTSDHAGNLVDNPNFEAGDKGWIKGTGWTIATGNQYLGTYCAEHDGSLGNGALGNNKRFPVGAGERYLIQCYLKKSVGADGSGVVRIDWYDDTDTAVTPAGALYSAAVSSWPTAWTFKRAVVTVPATAVYGILRVYRFGTTTIGQIFIDNLAVIQLLKDDDIDALNTTNGPAAAGADVTGDNTSNNTTYVEGSETRATYTYDIYGDLKIWNSGNAYFYDGSNVKVGEIYTDSGEMYFKGAAGT